MLLAPPHRLNTNLKFRIFSAFHVQSEKTNILLDILHKTLYSIVYIVEKPQVYKIKIEKSIS